MRKLFKYIKPYTFFAIVSPLMMMGEVLADLCLPFLMSFIVDFGIESNGLEAIGGSALASSIMSMIWGDGYTQLQIILTFGVLMLLITLVGGFFGVCCAYTAARAAQSFGHDLRRDAYKRVMSLSIEQTDRFTTGSLVTRMTNDISMIVDFVEQILRMFVRAPMFLVGGTVMLLLLEVKFGTVLLLSLPILLVTLIIVLSRAVPMYAVMQKKLDTVNSVVQENVSGARVVKAYVCEEHEYERFLDANNGLCDVNYRVLRLMAITTPVLTVLQNVAVIALILIGGIEIDAVGNTGMTTGTIMAGITYVTLVVSSIMMVTMMFQSVSRALASAKRVCEVMDTEPIIRGGMLQQRGEFDAPIAVAMKNVSFRYPTASGRPVLQNIDLEIKKGETFAIIGATGCGKTSLVNLIPRFYDATEGVVEINGRTIKDYELSELRQKIGYVMQKSELFSDTVEGNIRWGDPTADRQAIERAATVAQADGFVRTFNDGYETMIAEKGASLSGGQKQRLSIARALTRKPDILILDDSTSALDLATEAKLRSALREELRDTTVIMIAQRIASVRDADRIAVIENGTVADCGSHAELMERCAAYRDIYHSQTKQTEGVACNE